MPPDTQSFQTNTPDVLIVNDSMECTDEPMAPVESATDIVNVGNSHGPSMPRLTSATESQMMDCRPSTSSSSSRSRTPNMIRFNVQYCDRVITMDIPDTGTVGECFVLVMKVRLRLILFELFFS